MKTVKIANTIIVIRHEIKHRTDILCVSTNNTKTGYLVIFYIRILAKYNFPQPTTENVGIFGIVCPTEQMS